jgi:predicted Zn-dependent protease
MDEVRGELGELASALAGQAAEGEQAEARTTRLIRRKYRVGADKVASSGRLTDPVGTVLRLAARGRDVYVSSGPAAPELMTAARAMLPFGRPYRDGAPLHDEAADLPGPGGELAEPAGPLRQFREQADTAAAVAAARLGAGLRVLDCTVTETTSVEAFAAGRQPARSFACATIEASLLIEVRRGPARLRLRASRHAASLGDIPLAEMMTETGWRGAAMLAPLSGEPAAAPAGELLLTPSVSAAVLGVLAHDVIDRRLAPGPGPAPGPALPCALADDARAPGSRHSRPFDHEGTPTGESVLLGQDGVPGRLACRGDVPAGPAAQAGRTVQAGPTALTGNGLLAAFRAVPEVRPTNVRLAGARPYVLPDGYTGSLGYAIKGEGVQRFRSGDRIMFRVETASVSGGTVAGRTPVLTFAGTAHDILASVAAVSPPLTYLPGQGYSAAGAWTLLAGPPAHP